MYGRFFCPGFGADPAGIKTFSCIQIEKTVGQ